MNVFILFFYWCLGRIHTHWVFILGAALLMSTTVSLLVIEMAVRYSHLAGSTYNTIIPCMVHGTLSNSMDYWWMAVPLLLNSLSVIAFTIGGVKLIASQAPYLMRGFIIGNVIGIAYIVLLLWVGLFAIGISLPFTRQLSIWGTGIISCGFWYALLLLVIEVLVGFMLVALQRWYKKRKREDVLPNEHIFAERYYGR